MYISTLELRDYLVQVNDEVLEPGIDAKLARIIEKACGVLDTALGFSYNGYTLPEERTWYQYRGFYLLPPACLRSSVTLTTSIPYDPVTLRRTDGYMWPEGMYRATAQWGYGTAPAAAKQLALELAVNIWRNKDSAMFAQSLGADDYLALQSVSYLTAQQRLLVLELQRQAGETML
jgi:hypothetical protein